MQNGTQLPVFRTVDGKLLTCEGTVFWRMTGLGLRVGSADVEVVREGYSRVADVVASAACFLPI
jgi:hypothetical protein